jgi:prepilin-type N-terminal cleavage/methylation domain-containing protein
MNIKKATQGFTLVELIVVITLISIIGLGALASFTSLTSQNKLESDFRKVRDTLEIAKRKAVSGDGVTSCQNSGYDYLYAYVVIVSSDRIVTKINCTNTRDVRDVLSSAVTTYLFDPKVIASASPPFPLSIDFKYDGSAQRSDGVVNGAMTFTLTHQLPPTRTKCVIISKFGFINEC